MNLDERVARLEGVRQLWLNRLDTLDDNQRRMRSKLRSIETKLESLQRNTTAGFSGIDHDSVLLQVILFIVVIVGIVVNVASLFVRVRERTLIVVTI